MNIIKRRMKTQENIKRKINTQNATIYIYQEYRNILLNIMAANQNKMPYIPLKKEWLKRFDVDLSLFLGGDIKEITELVEELKKGLIAIAESYNYVSDGEFEIRKTNSKMIDVNQEEYMTKKPPIGIIPRYIWELKRIKELKSAIRRFIAVGKQIPIEWVNEYNDFCRRYECADKSSGTELEEDALSIGGESSESMDSVAKAINDSHYPKYLSMDVFNNAMKKNEQQGDMILRNVILVSENADKNTLMLKNLAGIAHNHDIDVIVFCDDERHDSWKGEETKEIDEIKDYVSAFENASNESNHIINTMLIVDFGKGSLLDYDKQLKDGIYSLTRTSRINNNYNFITCNEIITNLEKFNSEYYPICNMFDAYQSETGEDYYELTVIGDN